MRAATRRHPGHRWLAQIIRPSRPQPLAVCAAPWSLRGGSRTGRIGRPAGGPGTVERPERIDAHGRAPRHPALTGAGPLHPAPDPQAPPCLAMPPFRTDPVGR